MLLTTFSLSFILLIIYSINAVQSEPKCEVYINKRAFRPDKPLYIHKQYEIEYGLQVVDSRNPISVYSIDIYCINQGKSPLKATSLEQNNGIPVDISAYNCSRNINFITVLESNDFKKPLNFLNLLVDFKTLKTKNEKSTSLKLYINTEYGNGCSSTLNFVKHDGSTSIFDYDYYDGTSLWSRLKEILLASYARIIANPQVILAILIAIFFILVVLLAITILFMRLKSIRMNELKLNGTLVRLKNIKKHHSTSSGFEVLNNGVNLSGQAYAQSAPNPNISYPNLVDIEPIGLEQDNKHANEFQILRQQLIDKAENLNSKT